MWVWPFIDTIELIFQEPAKPQHALQNNALFLSKFKHANLAGEFPSWWYET